MPVPVAERRRLASRPSSTVCSPFPRMARSCIGKAAGQYAGADVVRSEWEAYRAYLASPGDYANPVLSPDQTRIAVALSGPAEPATSGSSISREAASTTRFTFDPANDDFPVWSPDSTDIVFSSNRSGRPQIYIKRCGRLRRGTPAHRSNWARPRAGPMTAVSCCSRAPTPKTGADIWALPDPRRIVGGHQARSPILRNAASPRPPAQFSPDGRWIAYTSNESSASDIYVRPFSADGTTNTGGAK